MKIARICLLLGAISRTVFPDDCDSYLPLAVGDTMSYLLSQCDFDECDTSLVTVTIADSFVRSDTVYYERYDGTWTDTLWAENGLVFTNGSGMFHGGPVCMRAYFECVDTTSNCPPACDGTDTCCSEWVLGPRSYGLSISYDTLTVPFSSGMPGSGVLDSCILTTWSSVSLGGSTWYAKGVGIAKHVLWVRASRSTYELVGSTRSCPVQLDLGTVPRTPSSARAPLALASHYDLRGRRLATSAPVSHAITIRQLPTGGTTFCWYGHGPRD